jgi:NADH dehydrogenase/NADH:ubiquinone oxidoreductase subunit G
LEQAAFTAAFDVLPTAITARANVIFPLCPLQEEDGSVVSFDGRIIPFRRAFKPLAGFTNVEVLSEVLAVAGGPRYDLTSLRQAIAQADPRYQSLVQATPNAFVTTQASPLFLTSTEAQRVRAYISATTYS